jgi:hypothetical protein
MSATMRHCGERQNIQSLNAMRSEAKTIADYLKSLPADRRKAIAAIRKVILTHLPKGYVEAMNWGVISYEVPLAIEPKTYNGKPLMYAALASQKNHMAVYLFGLYCGPKEKRAAFEKDWKQKTGKKPDMGASCVRFRKLEDIDLDTIGEIIASMPVAEFVKLSKR